MDWIKKNYDQFALAVLAFLLLAVSGYLIFLSISFPHIFDRIHNPPAENNHLTPLDMAGLQSAADSIAKPADWILPSNGKSIFISTPYVVDANGNLIDPRTGPPLHPPIPNKWLIDNHLDILDNNIQTEDPDGDGFTNLDEWKGTKGDGSDATNPMDKNSHPPYWTKLRLAKYIRQPFRLVLKGWDGDPKKQNSLSFQINAIDSAEPSQFLKIGDEISGSNGVKFKLIKFEEKHTTNASTGADEDVSELTIQNEATQATLVLVFNQEVNSPDSYALFHYLWNNTQFHVLKEKSFVLLPETNVLYNLVDIQDTGAVIKAPNGQQITVPPDQP